MMFLKVILYIVLIMVTFHSCDSFSLYDCGNNPGPFDYDYTWVDCNLKIRTVGMPMDDGEYESYIFALDGYEYIFDEETPDCGYWRYEWDISPIIEYEIIRNDTVWHEYDIKLPFPSKYYSMNHECDTTLLSSDCNLFVNTPVKLKYRFSDLLFKDGTTLPAPAPINTAIPENIDSTSTVHVRIEFAYSKLAIKGSDGNWVTNSRPFYIIR
ncbi:MAG: hypothetical protein K9N35_00220 [Candidatus Marinimicrobia bacterium]|nr:hypothetical protein [Candidatus Neomarinimicrobiota bacterium]